MQKSSNISMAKIFFLLLIFGSTSISMAEAEDHCTIWKGETICRMRPRKPPDWVNDPMKPEDGLVTGGTEPRETILVGQAAVAIKDPHAKILEGVLVLCMAPDPEDGKSPVMRLPRGNLRHYFSATKKEKSDGYVCTDLGVDVSHYSYSLEDYRAEPLGVFEINFDEGTNHLTGFYRTGALINSHTPTMYKTKFSLNKLSMVKDEDRKTWDELFFEPRPNLNTTNNHRLLNPIGPWAIYYK